MCTLSYKEIILLLKNIFTSHHIGKPETKKPIKIDNTECCDYF